MRKSIHIIVIITIFFINIILGNIVYAQVRCGTTQAYQTLFNNNPSLKTEFSNNQKRIAKTIRIPNARNLPLSDTIPVVVHIVLNNINQAKITDAIIQTQIDFLTTSFQGMNADTTRIPTAFKSKFGRNKLVFKLAQTTPFGDPTNGIERVISNKIFTIDTYDDAKQTEAGGSVAWDATRYYNIWVAEFTGGYLGFSVFPGDPRPFYLHGTIVDYRAFGINAPYEFSKYNEGKTLVHETGHFFNLHHIWGDDNGTCDSTDFKDAPPGQDDTPNQANSTGGNPDPAGTGRMILDACSSTNPGIMYQNYMDYTDDIAVVMFTNGQFDRMEAALTTSPDRSSLLQSTTYLTPPPIIIDPAKGYNITPNPFNNTVILRLPPTTKPLQYVQFLSLTGQIMKTISYGNGTTQSSIAYDVSSLAKGIYIVVLKFMDRKISEKIVKQ